MKNLIILILLLGNIIFLVIHWNSRITLKETHDKYNELEILYQAKSDSLSNSKANLERCMAVSESLEEELLESQFRSP